MAECQWTDEQLQRIVRIARRHVSEAKASGWECRPAPGDVVVECSQSPDDPPDPNCIGTLQWFETLAAWDDEYPDLKRPTWNLLPLSGATWGDDHEAVWTWEHSCFMVVPDLDAVLLEALLRDDE